VKSYKKLRTFGWAATRANPRILLTAVKTIHLVICYIAVRLQSEVNNIYHKRQLHMLNTFLRTVECKTKKHIQLWMLLDATCLCFSRNEGCIRFSEIHTHRYLHFPAVTLFIFQGTTQSSWKDMHITKWCSLQHSKNTINITLHLFYCSTTS
jgi:hypothetical protein